MDSKAVLATIEEAEKWRSRQARLRERLEETQARRRALEDEMTDIQTELASLDEAAATLARPTTSSGVEGDRLIR